MFNEESIKIFFTRIFTFYVELKAEERELYNWAKRFLRRQHSPPTVDPLHSIKARSSEISNDHQENMNISKEKNLETSGGGRLVVRRESRLSSSSPSVVTRRRRWWRRARPRATSCSPPCRTVTRDCPTKWWPAMCGATTSVEMSGPGLSTAEVEVLLAPVILMS